MRSKGRRGGGGGEDYSENLITPAHALSPKLQGMTDARFKRVLSPSNLADRTFSFDLDRPFSPFFSDWPSVIETESLRADPILQGGLSDSTAPFQDASSRSSFYPIEPESEEGGDASLKRRRVAIDE